MYRKAGYDFSGFELRDGWNVLIAYYKENPVVPIHTITYKANTGGTVRGTANKKIGDDYVDEWTGTNASTVRGATATANTNWTFTGWLEIMKVSDGGLPGESVCCCARLCFYIKRKWNIYNHRAF